MPQRSPTVLAMRMLLYRARRPSQNRNESRMESTAGGRKRWDIHANVSDGAIGRAHQLPEQSQTLQGKQPTLRAVRDLDRDPVRRQQIDNPNGILDLDPEDTGERCRVAENDWKTVLIGSRVTSSRLFFGGP
jgi:hypothetical protein